MENAGRRRSQTGHGTVPGRAAVVRTTVLGDGLLLLSVSEEPASPARGALADLTEAERTVALLAADGLSNRSIAARRGASARTVANQLASAYQKLGLSGRRELRALLLREAVRQS